MHFFDYNKLSRGAWQRLFLTDMCAGIVIFKFKYTPFISVDDMGIHVFVIPFMAAPISHVYMSV